MISRRRIAGMVLILALTGCAAARLHRDGLAAIDKGQYESGVTLLTQAVQSEPHNMTYRLHLEARRGAAGPPLVQRARPPRPHARPPPRPPRPGAGAAGRARPGRPPPPRGRGRAGTQGLRTQG